eukprot:1656973-Rhodomonas_salina.3
MAPQRSRLLSAWERMEEWEGLFGLEEDEAERARERQELNKIRDAIFHLRMEHNLKYPGSNKLPVPVFPYSNIKFSWRRHVSIAGDGRQMHSPGQAGEITTVMKVSMTLCWLAGGSYLDIVAHH